MNIGAPWPDLEEAESRVRGMQSKLHQWAVATEPPLIGTNTGESRMRRESHVRFGGRTAETHSLRDEQGAAVRPYTYLPVRSGFVYLVAVMDWFSRYVLAWRISNTLDAAFCLEALEEALGQGRPEIFNTDQGAQFTSAAFTGDVEAAEARVSMDGRGRVLDNIFIERLWRSLKYEDVYLKGYDTVPQLIEGVAAYFTFYNLERPHQAFDYETPSHVYHQAA